MESIEEWKPINGFENYEVSSLGRIKRISYYHRQFIAPNVAEVQLITQEKILKPNDNGKGYLKVNLASGRKRYSRFVHRLVAEAFLYRKDEENVVNHKDFNKQNNVVSNLEWCT